MKKKIIILFLLLCPLSTKAYFLMHQKTEFPFLPYFYDGVSVGNLDFTNWDEISGITRARKTANLGHFWAIDDGLVSPARMLAIRASDAASRGEWTLTGAIGADLEGITGAVINGTPYLYICDTGDNAADRASVQFWRFIEPTITGSNGTLTSGTDYATTTLVYPNPPVGEDGDAGRDAESCFLNPANGDLYIITKRTTQVQVFYLPYSANYVGTQTLQYLGDMFQLPNTNQAAGSANGGRAVDADISPDGKEILVKNYENVYLFKRPDVSATSTIYTALTQTPITVGAYVRGGQPSSQPNQEPQGEGVAFDPAGQNIFTASEYNATFDSGLTLYPFFKYLRLGNDSTEVSFQDGVNGYAGTSDTYIWTNAVNQGDNRGGETTFVADYDSATSERYGLLKFDLTGLIASSSKVVGADLQIYINTEGAIYDLRKMYQDWNEASTYTSLGNNPSYDDVEAASVYDAILGDYATLTGTTTVKIPIATVQGWIDGTIPNQGLLFDNVGTGGNGFQFRSSEFASVPNRPKLIIRYITK